MVISRVNPPLAAPELETLRAFLDYHRDTLRWKCDGLDREQLGTRHPPSTMTLGGLMKHLALVESSWFEDDLLGEDLMPPFDVIDWDADRDWEWRTGADDGPEEVRRIFDVAVARADAAIDRALAKDGLDTLSARTATRGPEAGRPYSLRWILLHMIEEYARHNGHADLIRESIDGQVGE
jgi:uncharacterized damage-inducible protein DinB